MEGKIIKYYRQKLRLTQGELGQGICSVTHLSKIERGITQYSDEIISLICDRLDINIQTEIQRYKQTKTQLDKWQESLIMQNRDDINRLKNDIETDEFIYLPEHFYYYMLLLARFHLFLNQTEKAFAIISDIKKRNLINLSPEEANLLKHVYGIYYFATNQIKNCITTLEGIDKNQYHNDEYYYHLALAHHSLYSNIKAYYFASKALNYFERTLNLSRVIDTEMFMLIQLNAKEPYDFDYTKEKYEKLIHLCDMCQDPKRKSKLLNNLAFEHTRRGYYKEASDLQHQAMQLISKDNPLYLTVLDGYIDACSKGRLLPIETLLELCQHGLNLAGDKNDDMYISFQLHIFSIQQNEVQYFQYLAAKVIPHFRKTGYKMIVEHYEKKLFYYLLKQNKTQDALNLAKSIVDSKRTYYEEDI